MGCSGLRGWVGSVGGAIPRPMPSIWDSWVAVKELNWGFLKIRGTILGIP